MKYIIVLGDGMADEPIGNLGGRTPLQAADTPAMDWLAAHGRCGLLKTVPDGYHPGSEIANLSVLGYDLDRVFEGRGSLEAASMGVDIESGEMAMRCNLVCIATRAMLGQTLAMQGITKMIPQDRKRWYVKAPAFSFEKLTGMDAYLSPEMKSTGEAIGYDNRLNRALYKALQASGVKMKEYGTVIVTLADEDKEEALPLVKRFYQLGFNIEATAGTAAFLKQHGIRTRLRGKLSEGSEEILDSIRAGYVSYIINTRAILSGVHYEDGVAIRRCAVQNGVTIFTSLDTVRIVLDVLEEITPQISTINSND